MICFVFDYNESKRLVEHLREKLNEKSIIVVPYVVFIVVQQNCLSSIEGSYNVN